MTDRQLDTIYAYAEATARAKALRSRLRPGETGPARYDALCAARAAAGARRDVLLVVPELALAAARRGR